MASKLYVGNLSYSTDKDTLQNLFSEYGNIVSSTVITDKQTGNSKGFGFVEFEDELCAKKAVSALNGREVDGRRIRVSEAREKEK
ncbi:MAG: RNA-binding protein [Treponema sp.]|nr:RNA-binding protein [Treponema sp.]